MVNNKLLNKSTFYGTEPENIFSNLYLTGIIIIKQPWVINLKHF